VSDEVDLLLPFRLTDEMFRHQKSESGQYAESEANPEHARPLLPKPKLNLM